MGTFKAKKTALVFLVIVSLCVFSFVIPSLRPGFAAFTRFPLSFLAALKNEAGALLFFHKNMVESRRLAVRAQLLERQLVDREEDRLENARLRELLGFREKAGYKVVPAAVIGRSPSSWSSTLIINKGSAHGIRKGYVCVSFLGLIGRITEVYPSSSMVMLINDPNLCVSCLSQRSRQEGLICGSLSGVLLMKYLEKDSDLKPSDTVITSGLTDIPKGIVVGTVSEVREDMSGMSRYAVVRPAVKLASVEEVLVIVP